jgi:parvulin-like peptidyl-prolyl isomerase
MLLCLASTAQGKIVDGVVAVVDNQAVTFSEVRQAAGDALAVDAGEADSLLREERDPAKVRAWIAPLVDTLLVRRELSKAGQGVVDSDVERVVESVRKQNNLDEAGFRKALELEGLSLPAYRARLRWQLERTALLRARKAKELSVTAEEARDWYREQGERYAEGGEVRLAVLTLPYGVEGEKDRTLQAHLAARAAAELLGAGKKLDEVAGLLSGRFGAVRLLPGDFMKEEDLPDDLRKEVRRLRTGELSAPFFTEEGARVISVLARRGGTLPDFAAVKDAVTEELTDRRSEKAFADIMVALRSEAAVGYRY